MVNKIKCVGGVLDGTDAEVKGIYLTLDTKGNQKYLHESDVIGHPNNMYRLHIADVLNTRMNFYVWENNQELLNKFLNSYLNPKF